MATGRTSVNQAPSNGTNYPFVEDCTLGESILDAYFGYEDLNCEVTYPVTLTGYSASYKLEDANGLILFNELLSAATQVPWGDRYVIEWLTSTGVFRIVTTSNTVVVGDGVLDPRTINRIPGRVRSITVESEKFTGNIRFQSGFNVSASVGDTILTDGGRAYTVLNIDGVPGAGEGRVDGCEEYVPVIRRINQVEPDASGLFTIQAEDCFRLQPPLSVTTTESGFRSAAFAAGGLTSLEAKSALKLYDDCRPCCDCDFFVRTYRGLKRTREKWKVVAEVLEVVRDTYDSNRNRWLKERQCRLDNPLRVIAQSETGCKAFIGLSYCNMSKCCLTGLELRVTLQRYDGTTLVTAVPEVAGLPEAYLEASSTKGEERYTPDFFPGGKAWPVLRFTPDYANPQTTSMARMRLCFSCNETSVLKVTASAHAPDPGPAPNGETCTLPTPETPADIAAIWEASGIPSNTLRAIVSTVIPMNPNPAEYSCEC